MQSNINLVFGGSGLIGQSLKKLLRKNKKFIFISKNKNNNFYQFNLDKNIKKFPYKNVNKCFFLASPRITKNNLKKKIFKKEFYWLKKIILNIKIKKLIYLSSSSIYYNKHHTVGFNKRNCENLILNNKNKFISFQIWRPFNLVGNKYYNSDHFHNYLFKKMFIEKKKKNIFYGSPNDKRGYASVESFVKILNKFSYKNESFLKDYGNLNVIKVEEIIKIFNEYYYKINRTNFKYKFMKKKSNLNVIKLNKSNICIDTDSKKVFIKYLKNSFDVKKL